MYYMNRYTAYALSAALGYPMGAEGNEYPESAPEIMARDPNQVSPCVLAVTVLSPLL